MKVQPILRIGCLFFKLKSFNTYFSDLFSVRLPRVMWMNGEKYVGICRAVDIFIIPAEIILTSVDKVRKADNLMNKPDNKA
jgi:hypothetical protein